jgi:inositol phosphorylceramide synthase catalytic subunit
MADSDVEPLPHDVVPFAAACRIAVGALPLGLVALVYAAMGKVRNVGVSPASVHLCDLRAREVALFGISMNGARVTPNDWWQAHSSRALDAVCAVPYATFVLVCAAFAVWLYGRDYARMVRFGWCFLALNLAGFATYHLYPAAPPWYCHAHGCTVDVSAMASEGPALARVDAWIGVPYFASMYSRSSAVFGAIPSLHVAYALLVVLEGWDVLPGAWRAASAAFFALMCFAAVYLDHHWVEDVIAGAVCSVVVASVARAVTAPRLAEAP